MLIKIKSNYTFSRSDRKKQANSLECIRLNIWHYLKWNLQSFSWAVWNDIQVDAYVAQLYRFYQTVGLCLWF